MRRQRGAQFHLPDHDGADDHRAAYLAGHYYVAAVGVIRARHLYHLYEHAYMGCFQRGGTVQ